MAGYILLLVGAAGVCELANRAMERALEGRRWRLIVIGPILGVIAGIMFVWAVVASGVGDRAVFVGGVALFGWVFVIWYRSAHRLHVEMRGPDVIAREGSPHEVIERDDGSSPR